MNEQESYILERHVWRVARLAAALMPKTSKWDVLPPRHDIKHAVEAAIEIIEEAEKQCGVKNAK